MITRPFDASHWLLLLLLLVADDIRPAIVTDGNCSTFDPHADDLSSTLVLACLMADGIQLLLKVGNAFCLLFDLHLVLTIDNVHEHLSFILLTHLRLSPPALASRLQDMDTTALRGCIQRHDVAFGAG